MMGTIMTMTTDHTDLIARLRTEVIKPEHLLPLAESIVDSQPVVATYAACEWDCLDENGKVWIAAIVGEAIRRTQGVARVGQGKHPSHVTRFSDASSYDEVCTLCGTTDISGGGWGKLARPCRISDEAATAISQLSAENKRLREGMTSCIGTLSGPQRGNYIVQLEFESWEARDQVLNALTALKGGSDAT